MHWDAENRRWEGRNPGDGWGDAEGPGGLSFDESRGRQYASGDPLRPGDHPPHLPDVTHREPDGSGWTLRNRGDTKGWMGYQEQVTGIERTPDGHLGEYTRTHPVTGKPVDYDGRTFRGDPPVETYLEAKDGYEEMASHPDGKFARQKSRELVEQALRQLAALPDGARIEWHVSTSRGAEAIERLLTSKRIRTIDVVYTPKG